MLRRRRRSGGATWLTPKLGAWIVGSTASSVAGSVVGFGVAWTATGFGGGVAALVLMLWSAPLVVFSLAGGALGDRLGHRRMLIMTNLAQAGVALSGGPVVLGATGSPVVLAVFATGLGTVQALRTPSAGSAVRLFVDDDQLTPALAATTTLTQVLTLTAPALAGIVVSLWGLGGCLAVLVVAETASAVVFALVRPPLAPEPSVTAPVRRQLMQGLALVVTSGQACRLLLSLALVAGSMLPLLTVMIPLVARDRAWTASEAGLLASGWTAGSILVGLVVSGRRAGQPPRRPLFTGPSVAALGCITVALAQWSWLGVVGMVLVGAGVRTYTSVTAPRLLTLAPREMAARLQSILLLVQQSAVLIMVGTFGFVSEHGGTVTALALAAALTVLGGAVALRAVTGDG